MADKNPKGHRERVRERFLSLCKSSENKSSTHDTDDTFILELLLTYAIPRRDTRPIAEQLLSEFGSLPDVLSASPEILSKVKGIGDVSVIFLKLIDFLRIHYAEGKPLTGEPAELTEQQIPLFIEKISENKSPDQTIPQTKIIKEEKKQNQRSGLFSKAVLKETIDLLPDLPDTDSLDEVKQYFRDNLHYSAESTRNRYSNYIIQRMFPKGKTDPVLRNFAVRFREDRNLKEACFYRFMKSEPLTEEIIHELLLPRIGTGELSRQKIIQYLTDRFPGYKSIKDCVKGLVDALSAGGIVKADRTKISYAFRDIPLPTFAFILHSEFPEPGMYDLSLAEENRIFKSMMWKSDQILPMIYELRNHDLISKVSEIDSVRQFTTKKTLGEVVEKLGADRSHS